MIDAMPHAKTSLRVTHVPPSGQTLSCGFLFSRNFLRTLVSTNRVKNKKHHKNNNSKESSVICDTKDLLLTLEN